MLVVIFAGSGRWHVRGVYQKGVTACWVLQDASLIAALVSHNSIGACSSRCPWVIEVPDRGRVSSFPSSWRLQHHPHDRVFGFSHPDTNLQLLSEWAFVRTANTSRFYTMSPGPAAKPLGLADTCQEPLPADMQNLYESGREDHRSRQSNLSCRL